MHQGCPGGPTRPRVGDRVLSIAKLRVDAEAYYLDLVVSGGDEYYSERGEVPGRWVGTGIEALGLVGQVDGDALRAVLTGRDATTGEQLASARKVPGFDVTFSAPKSVSLLFALAQGDVKNKVVTAHDVAVASALAYLEREACQVRRGHAGVRQLAGHGFVGAAFRHRTSRAGDPQLHTHVLVANLARGADDAWSALDARPLYRQGRTAGYLYQAQLRHELTQRLGLGWRAAVRGSAELDGVPDPVLKAFSRRRTEIEPQRWPGTARRPVTAHRSPRWLPAVPSVRTPIWARCGRSGGTGQPGSAFPVPTRSPWSDAPRPTPFPRWTRPSWPAC